MPLLCDTSCEIDWLRRGKRRARKENAQSENALLHPVRQLVARRAAPDRTEEKTVVYAVTGPEGRVGETDDVHPLLKDVEGLIEDVVDHRGAARGAGGRE